MADREDRAAVLLERTLAARAGEAPSVPGMAERVRGRARRRRATGVVAACAVAAVLAAGVPIGVQLMARDLVEVPVADESPRDDTRRDDTVEPAPEGWRWESYRGIQLQVPDGWGWGTTGWPPCLDINSGAYVGRPDGGVIPAIGCSNPFPVLSERAPYVWLGDLLAGDLAEGEEVTRPAGHGWFEVQTLRGGVPVTVFSDDADLRNAILASIREIEHVDANSCPVQHAISAEPSKRPDPTTGGLEAVENVTGAAVCRYSLRDVLPDPLISSSRLDRETARRLVAAITAAPAGSGPNSKECSFEVYGDEIIVLRIEASGATQEVYLRYSGCGHHGTDDGVTRRELTAQIVRPVLSGPHTVLQADGPMGDLIFGS